MTEVERYWHEAHARHHARSTRRAAVPCASVVPQLLAVWAAVVGWCVAMVVLIF